MKLHRWQTPQIFIKSKTAQMTNSSNIHQKWNCTNDKLQIFRLKFLGFKKMGWMRKVCLISVQLAYKHCILSSLAGILTIPIFLSTQLVRIQYFYKTRMYQMTFNSFLKAYCHPLSTGRSDLIGGAIRDPRSNPKSDSRSEIQLSGWLFNWLVVTTELQTITVLIPFQLGSRKT